MNDILWLRFADDSGLPDRLSAQDQKNLAAVFDTAVDSPWTRALARTGLRAQPTQMIRFLHGTAYINWTAMTAIMTGGMMMPVRTATGFAYDTNKSTGTVWRFFVNQWKVSAYLAATLSAPLPDRDSDRIEESLALGMALLSLTPHLPAHTPQQLGAWLADPEAAPAQVRKPLQQLQQLQMRRTQLSASWRSIVHGDNSAPPDTSLPAFFWNEPQPADTAAAARPTAANRIWTGIPIVKGSITGTVRIIRHASPDDMDDAETLTGQILAFPRARPETVLFFGHAAAILYAEGGALSHACTVAREQKIICITGLGSGFMDSIRDGDTVAVDATSGRVEICNPAQPVL